MLLAKECPRMIYTGDLLCCRTASDKLLFLIVMEDLLLQDVDVKVSVRSSLEQTSYLQHYIDFCSKYENPKEIYQSMSKEVKEKLRGLAGKNEHYHYHYKYKIYLDMNPEPQLF